MEHQIKTIAATIITDPSGPPIKNPSQVVDFINRLKDIVLGVAGIAAVAMILYGAFLLITSGGNPDKMTKAKQTLTWAIIGLVVVIAAYIIVYFIAKVLGGGATS